MARYQCRACGFDEEIAWDGRLVCPKCGSTNGRVATAVEDIPEDLMDQICRQMREWLDAHPEYSDEEEKEGE
jgi:uncharacterized Zn finger protein (UPF0148 family)